MNDLSDIRYWCDGDLEKPVSCPACASSELTVLYTGLVDYEENIPGVWGMVKCNLCGTLCLSPRPNKFAIGKAYRNYYTHLSPVCENQNYNGTSIVWQWINGYIAQKFGDPTRKTSQFGNVFTRLLPPLRQQVDYLYRHLPHKPGRLLDVGCGNGAFMLRAQNSGWHAQGIEPDKAAAIQASKHGFEVFEGSIENVVIEEPYDVVTLSHVLEHLHDPKGALLECRNFLKPGGQLWIATPNIASLGHKLFKSAWQSLETPRHITMLSSRALRRMLGEAGFENVRFVRRGRGSRKRLEASNTRAIVSGLPMRRIALLSLLVDVFACLSPYGAEEIVVTARRPDTGR